MKETELLLPLVGDIYDAALDPQRWPAVLQKAAAFVHGLSGFIFAKDVIAQSGDLVYGDGAITQDYVQLYYEKYAKLDPSSTALIFSEIGQLNSTVDLLPYDEFVETRFYKEWAKPQGLVDVLCVILDKSTRSVATFGVFRHECHGLVDAAMRRRMRLIAPHVRRAVLVSKVIDLKTAEATRLADALDSIVAGMFLLNAAGRIVHANAAGHLILQRQDYLYGFDGRLTARDPQANRILGEVLMSAGNGEVAPETKGTAVTLMAQNGERHVAHILPLTSGERRRAARTYAAVAAVFVHKASLNTPSAPEAIAKAYKLTPMELRVLLAVVEVGGISEVADALGISPETVKTHLGRVYSKAGVHRQADLVKLVAGYASPLAV